MNTNKSGLTFLTAPLLLGLLALAASPNFTFAEEKPAGRIHYDGVATGNKCKISGDSTIHKWEMESAIMTGFMEADANFPESALTDAEAAKPATEVVLRVKAFKSGKQKMDENMQGALNAAKYPTINYKLISLKPVSPAGTTGRCKFEATGALTISGNTLTNTMPVTIERKDGKLHVVGKANIKMTEYKVKPPVISLPLVPDITTYDDLEITYDWSLAPKQAAAAAPAATPEAAAAK